MCNSISINTEKSFDFRSKKSVSRLLIIQMLYALENNAHYTKDNLESILSDILEMSKFKIKYNKLFLKTLFSYVIRYGQEINNLIDKYIEKDASKMRLSVIGRLIIVTAIIEILYFPDTDQPIIISQFILLSELFLDQLDLKFINAIIDVVRKEYSATSNNN